MTFATIIGPKNTHHYEASPFEVTNQKLPKIAIYPRNLGYSQKKSKKILSVLKKGPKINVFQLIWELNSPKLSNLVTNHQNQAKEGGEWLKTVIKRQKLHWKVKNSPNFAKTVKNRPKKTHKRPIDSFASKRVTGTA